MASVLEIIVSVITGNSQANLDKLNKSLSGVGKEGQTAEQKLGGMVKKMAGMAGVALGAGVAIMGLTRFLKSSVDEAANAEEIQAKLGAVIAATGSAAGMTAEEVNLLADRMSYLTGVDDEAIVSAETLMLTFTRISEDTFPRAMQASLDMSTILKTDLTAAVKMVGMALNSPVEGFAKLQRAGVQFTAAEKELLKVLVETGREAEAQGLILDKLEGKFQGAALAAGNTYAGAIKKLDVAFGNLKEEIGRGVIPTLAKLATSLTNLMTFERLQGDVMDQLGWSLQEYNNAMRDAGISGFDFAGKIEWMNGLLEEQADKTGDVQRTMVLLGSASESSANQVDILAASTEEAGEAADDAKGAFDDWAKGLNTNLTKAIEDAIEKTSWLINGGAELQAAWEKVNFDLTEKLITPQQARTAFQALYTETTALQLKLNMITATEAAENIASTLNVTLTEAREILDDIIRKTQNDYQIAIRVYYEYYGVPTQPISYYTGGGNQRAGGGSVSAMTPYMVGERGPELFVPQQSGTIVPNDRVGAAGGKTVNVYFQSPILGFADEYELARKLKPIIKRYIS